MVMMLLASLTINETTNNDDFTTVNTNFSAEIIMGFVKLVITIHLGFSSKSSLAVFEFPVTLVVQVVLSFDLPYS